MGFPADCIEHDIHIVNDIFERCGDVIDRLVYAQAPERIVIHASGANYFRSTTLGKLHSNMTDPARRAMDQNGMIFVKVRQFKERLPGSESHMGEGRRLDMVEGFGLGSDICGGRQYKFSVRAIP